MEVYQNLHQMKKRISATCEFITDAIAPLTLASNKLSALTPPAGEAQRLHQTTIQAFSQQLEAVKNRITQILHKRREFADNAKKTEDEFEKVQKQIDMNQKKLSTKKANEAQATINGLQVQQQKLVDILQLALNEMTTLEYETNVLVQDFYGVFNLNIPKVKAPPVMGIPQNQVVKQQVQQNNFQTSPPPPPPPQKSFNPLDDDLLGFKPKQVVPQQAAFDPTKFVQMDPAKIQQQKALPPTTNFSSIIPNNSFHKSAPPVPIQFQNTSKPAGMVIPPATPTNEPSSPTNAVIKQKPTFSKPKIISPAEKAAAAAQKLAEEQRLQAEEEAKQAKVQQALESGNYWQEEEQPVQAAQIVEEAPVAYDPYSQPTQEVAAQPVVEEQAYDPYAQSYEQQPQQSYEQQPQQSYDQNQQYGYDQQYPQDQYQQQQYDQAQYNYDPNQQYNQGTYDQNQQYNQGTYDPYADQW